jgi:hypothetical protein
VAEGTEEKDEEDSGSGGHSVAGYEYQIDVSVWLAVDLVLANRLAHELVLEPASEEDIEADLAENEPGRLTSTAALDGYRLSVQPTSRDGCLCSRNGRIPLTKSGWLPPLATYESAEPAS